MEKHKKIGQKIKYHTNLLLIATLLIVSIPFLVLYSVSYFNNNLKQLEIIAEQTTSQVDSIHQNIITFSKWIPADKDLLSYLKRLSSKPAGDFQAKSLIANRLTELTGHASNVSDIILLLPNGISSSIFLTENELKKLQKSGWYLSLKDDEVISSFSPIDSETGDFYYFVKLDTISNITGEMIICVKGDMLQSTIDIANRSFSHSIWLDNRNFSINDNSFPDASWMEKEVLTNIQYNYYSSETMSNSHGLIHIYNTEAAHWKFITFIPYASLLKQIFPMLFIIIIALLFISFAASFVLSPMIHNLVHPIEELSESMKKLPYSDTEPVIIHTGDEIEELANAFNQMSNMLKQHINMLLEEQKKEEQMRYGLMISQINPHFIYNTMNTINYLARKKRTDDIVVINNALIHIMKDCLRISEFSVFDTLENEINVTKEYLIIQNYRYQEHVRTIWETDNSLLHKNIPKHIIQPLIENSLIHGFFSGDEEEPAEAEQKIIHISILPLPGAPGIQIQVKDNGIGIDMEKYRTLCESLDSIHAGDESTRGKHIGLANIKWRLSYLLGNNQSLEIIPAIPNGTIVTIRLFEA